MTNEIPRFDIVVASNDAESLERNLMASEIVRTGRAPVHVEQGAPSAAIAYNRGLGATTAPYVIFAHQDVYFPPFWESRLRAAIKRLDAEHPDWALLAPFGMTAEEEHVGNVWSTSLGARVGRIPRGLEEVQSFDELVIVMRREAGLRFDEALPLYHLYGTDIVQSAFAAGYSAHVADLPVVHNDKFHGRLGDDFTQGYQFVRRKWRDRLPLRTPILRIRWHGLDLPIYRLRAARGIAKRRARALDTATDPKLFSARCGWE